MSFTFSFNQLDKNMYIDKIKKSETNIIDHTKDNDSQTNLIQTNNQEIQTNIINSRNQDIQTNIIDHTKNEEIQTNINIENEKINENKQITNDIKQSVIKPNKYLVFTGIILTTINILRVFI